MSVLSVHPREIQTPWTQTTTQEILHRYAVEGVDNVRSCHRTGYDRLQHAQHAES